MNRENRAGGRDNGELVVFYVGPLLCAIETAVIREIIKFQPVTRVFGAPEYVAGVINLRGDIVTVINLKNKFGIAEEEPPAVQNMIVSNFRGEPVGLLVDQIEDIIRVDLQCIEPAPSNVRGVAGAYFAGIYKLEETLASILDVDKVLRKVAP